jgi:RND family efflux transporter MFP subunit
MKNLLLSLLGVLVGLASCQNSDEHRHDDGHDHSHEVALDTESISLTVYSTNAELFVDFQPLIQNQENTLHIHVSQIGTRFLPAESGSVRALLSIDGRSFEGKVTKPSEPGIFHVDIQPEVAGNGMLEIHFEGDMGKETFEMGQVEVFSSRATAELRKKESASGTEITYLKDQSWGTEFLSVPVADVPFQEIIKTTGTILSAPGDETVLTAKSSGTVLFSGNKTIIGSAISAGDKLFTIAASDLTQSNPEVIYLEAKSNFERTKAEFERAQALLPDKIISEKDYLSAKTAFEQAQNTYKVVAKNYSVAGQGVVSPSTGFLKNILVSEGQFVEAGTPLAHISKNKKLLLQAQVSQKYFQKLPEISGANFKMAGHPEVFSTKSMNGRVVSFGKTTSAASPFVPITFEIDNVGQIIPGVVVEVFLKTNAKENSVVIPLEALMEEQGLFFVFVQTGGETFEKREITLGGTDGQMITVRSGLQAGERVVSKGAYAIKLASAGGELPEHGHSH